jgi:predicted RNase H-like HicB family nuclease
MRLEVEQEEDGRWLAEAVALPGALAYGASRPEAIAKVEALVLRVLADRLDHGERAPDLDLLFSAA